MFFASLFVSQCISCGHNRNVGKDVNKRRMRCGKGRTT